MLNKLHTNLFFKVTIAMMVFSSISFLIATISLKSADAQIRELSSSNYELEDSSRTLKNRIDLYDSQISYLSEQKESFSDLNTDLQSQIVELEESLDSLESELDSYLHNQSTEFPFAVPSSGVLPNYASGYGENMRGMQHFAVDIWTTTENYGMISSHKGNPVYSACDGRVVAFDYDNGAITILCDEISSEYNVPSYTNVYTYYGHMGNGETKETFFEIGQGQRVEKGQLIGYQGDLSKFFPEMRNVHLHFQLWAGSMNFSSDSSNGPHNPCLYIGGNCNVPGTVFVANESL